jgi:signal transduction histidine kinase
MFDPFQTSKQKGTGLGLPMSRTIAEAHGGTLHYVPLDTGGACFVLTLPATETVT